jgi:hypothetical protein
MRSLYQTERSRTAYEPRKSQTICAHFRPGKTWIILGVALAIGGIAAFAANSFLSKQVEAIEARGKGKLVSVVVAKTDIARGVKLDSQQRRGAQRAA